MRQILTQLKYQLDLLKEVWDQQGELNSILRTLVDVMEVWASVSLPTIDLIPRRRGICTFRSRKVD